MLPKLDAKEWEVANVRAFYSKYLNEEAVEREVERYLTARELAERKLAEQRRLEEWARILEHPAWIALLLTVLCVYSHYAFGLTKLPAIILKQVVFLQPPNNLKDVPVTAGLLITAGLSYQTTRRSLKACIPALALLLDLCCAGLIVAIVPRFLRWAYSQLRQLWLWVSLEVLCGYLGLNASHVQWTFYICVVTALFARQMKHVFKASMKV